MKRFHYSLKIKMDDYVHSIYKSSKNFPREEIYGVTSQLRRSALSVVLNYVEGYARNSPKTLLHFLRISYASLKESKYLFSFSLREGYMDNEQYLELSSLADEIGAMLWRTISAINRNLK